MCRWINESINTSDIEVRLPQDLRDMIGELYEADSANQSVVYLQVCDDLDAFVKQLVPLKILSKQEWSLIRQKYCLMEK